MSYELPPLPYDFGALEPYIDARTMELHYTKHHAGYVQNLNKALQGHELLAGKSLVSIISDIRMVPEDIRQSVRNNGGGHLNHSLFWEVMGPDKGGEPAGNLREGIISTFGDIPRFKEEFFYAAITRFGSGWAWLGMDSRGQLEILSTANQDSPLMMGYRPILGLDVWEHAYYLKYQNRRADYITAWWSVVNWEKVAEFYESCLDMQSRTKHLKG